METPQGSAYLLATPLRALADEFALYGVDLEIRDRSSRAVDNAWTPHGL